MPRGKKSGVDRLLSQITDIAPADHPPRRPLAVAAPPYQTLFGDYVADLTKAQQEAEAWLDGLVRGIERREKKDRKAALLEVRQDAPTAPASHESVLATCRRYWLLCDALNGQHPPDQRIGPEQLTLGWLTEAGHRDLAELLGLLTYVPVGLDADGRWV
jgi:hypothetical protein